MMSLYLLIPLLPLLASLGLFLAGQRLGDGAGKLATAVIAATFGLSVAALVEVLQTGPITLAAYPLIQAGDLSIELGFYLDRLTAVMLLFVTGISTLVHAYSTRYMVGDDRYGRFFAVMTLFTFSMVMVVASGNLLVTFMFWEVMGVCSYLLISHWSDRPSAAAGATKAFLVNAIADVGFSAGVILTLAIYGTADIQAILASAPTVGAQSIDLFAWFGGGAPVQANTLILLCLLSGALGKAAQMPFHVWLPFAMEAPTAVSALTVTMAHSGPFLLIRLHPLLFESPAAMTVVLVLGGLTAVLAALVSVTQSDIKRLLAYSTISQIGFMFMACGAGAFGAALFHLVAHGLLRVFLFLSTGNSLQALAPPAHPEAQQAARPGRPRPVAAAIGAFLLTLVPAWVLFSGPYEALWTLHGHPAAGVAFWVVGLCTLFATSLYLFRGIADAFRDTPSLRPSLASPVHLAVIGLAGIVLAFLLPAIWSGFGGFLAEAFGQAARAGAGAAPDPGTGGVPRLLAPLGALVVGVGFGFALHGRTPGAGSEWRKSLYVLFVNKLYFDEIYDAYVVRLLLRFASWLTEMDSWFDRAPALVARRLAPQMAAANSVRSRLGELGDSVDRILQAPLRVTLQQHYLIVIGGLLIMLGVFYFLQV